MYHYLMYVSYANQPFTDASLTDLLKASHSNNRELDVTGMLLFIDGKFIQVLEGEKQVVRDLFEIIRQDPRHKKVNVIIEGRTEKRNFAEWHMGFKSLSGPDFKRIIGYKDIESYFKDVAVNEESHVTHIFLKLFYNKYYKDLTTI